MEKSFTEQDSLNVINEMISQARNNYQKGAGSYCIFWGYLIAVLSLANFVLLHLLINMDVNYNYAYYVWWLTIPAMIFYFIHAFRSSKKQLVYTHIDKIIGNSWIAFAIGCSVFLFTIYCFAYYFKMPNAFLLVTPGILTMVGLGQFISAAALRFNLYRISAAIFWLGAVLSILALLIFSRGDIQFIIMSVCMITGFCIPGHILNRKAEKNV